MVSDPRNELMAWMETDYSKDMHSRWKIKEYLGIMGETPLITLLANYLRAATFLVE